MSLLLPAGLLGLFGLLIPLLVHLQRQIQRSPIQFAALRWLSAAARPRQRLRLQQWPLLVARLMLISIAAVLLAQPLWFGAAPADRWVLLHPQLVPSTTETAEENIEYRWLAAGFPLVAQPAPQGPWPVASLIREADAELPASMELEVRLPQVVAGLDGERLALSRQLTVSVDETVRPSDQDADDTRPSWSVRNDDLEHPALPYINAATTALTASADAESDALAAVSSVDRDSLNKPPLAAAGALIWIATQAPADRPALNQWIRDGGVALWLSADSTAVLEQSFMIWRSADGERWLSARRLGAGWLLQPNIALRAAEFPELLEPGFPDLLLAWLDRTAKNPDSIFARDLQPRQVQSEPIVRGQALHTTLVWLLLVLLLIERVLAAFALRSKQ